MTAYSLTKTRFCEGIWEGVIAADTAGATEPRVEVRLREENVPGVQVQAAGEPGRWALKVPVAARLLADGTHTFLISETETGQILGDFSIIAGDAAGEDIRAEMDLLRAELDMLKRSFRRHCRETA